MPLLVSSFMRCSKSKCARAFAPCFDTIFSSSSSSRSRSRSEMHVCDRKIRNHKNGANIIVAEKKRSKLQQEIQMEGMTESQQYLQGTGAYITGHSLPIGIMCQIFATTKNNVAPRSPRHRASSARRGESARPHRPPGAHTHSPRRPARRTRRGFRRTARNRSATRATSRKSPVCMRACVCGFCAMRGGLIMSKFARA